MKALPAQCLPCGAVPVQIAQACAHQQEGDFGTAAQGRTLACYERRGSSHYLEATSIFASKFDRLIQKQPGQP